MIAAYLICRVQLRDLHQFATAPRVASAAGVMLSAHPEYPESRAASMGQTLVPPADFARESVSGVPGFRRADASAARRSDPRLPGFPLVLVVSATDLDSRHCACRLQIAHSQCLQVRLELR